MRGFAVYRHRRQIEAAPIVAFDRERCTVTVRQAPGGDAEFLTFRDPTLFVRRPPQPGDVAVLCDGHMDVVTAEAFRRDYLRDVPELEIISGTPEQSQRLLEAWNDTFRTAHPLVQVFDDASGPVVAPLLRSPSNPKGWKLEDLLEQVAAEIDARNGFIAGHDTGLSVTVDTHNAKLCTALENLARSHRAVCSYVSKALAERP